MRSFARLSRSEFTLLAQPRATSRTSIACICLRVGFWAFPVADNDAIGRRKVVNFEQSIRIVVENLQKVTYHCGPFCTYFSTAGTSDEKLGEV